MTLVSAEAGFASPPNPKPARAIARRPAVRCAGALALAIAVTALVSTPMLRFEGWRWWALAALTAQVWLCALPVHREALTRRSPTALLGSIGTALPWLWCVHAVLADRDDAHLHSAAISAALVVIVDVARRASPGNLEGVPAWLAGAIGALAVLAGGLWWSEGSQRAVGAALGVLFVGAPAAPALTLSLARLSVARRSHALGCAIGSGQALRATATVDTIVLDKDRTVTTGDLTVVHVEPVDPDHDRNIRWFAGALEHESDHPIGRAIAKLAGTGWLTNVQHVPGHGISGSVDRHPVRVGDPAWLGIMATAAVGKPIGVEVDGRPLGHLCVWDDVRPEASRSLQALTALGLEVEVLSADTEADSRHLADLLGIPHVHADQDREQRTDLVARLEGNGRRVAYVGLPGPLNDKALEKATVGISTTGPGIMVDDLDVMRLPGIVALCRAFVDRSRLGQRVALAGTIAGCVVAAAGQLTPFGASMVATALCVVAALFGGGLPGATIVGGQGRRGRQHG